MEKSTGTSRFTYWLSSEFSNSAWGTHCSGYHTSFIPFKNVVTESVKNMPDVQNIFWTIPTYMKYLVILAQQNFGICVASVELFRFSCIICELLWFLVGITSATYMKKSFVCSMYLQRRACWLMKIASVIAIFAMKAFANVCSMMIWTLPVPVPSSLCTNQASFNDFENFLQTDVSTFVYFPAKNGTLTRAISCLSVLLKVTVKVRTSVFASAMVPYFIVPRVICF